MHRPKVVMVLALLVVAALHYPFVPRTIWEYDECLYAAAIEKFEPLLHHPPPPGSPVYIGFAKMVALATPDAFTAMLITSILAVAAGFLAFVFAFREIYGVRHDGLWCAVIGATLLYASPAVLVSGTLPQADAGALALLGFAIWGCARAISEERTTWVTAALCALASALCVGWRIQLCIAVVPMFLTTVAMMRTWRERFVAVNVFGMVCLAWLTPLVVATGGPVPFWRWMSGQAAYYAAHDAGLSRSGRSAAHIALRFLAHPWGPKWLSLPLLAIAIAGMAVLRRNRRLVPLAIGSVIYLAFALATMDPADAVRYAIPTLPFVALLAASVLANARIIRPIAMNLRWGTGSRWEGSFELHQSAGRAAGSSGESLSRSITVLVVLLYAVGAVYYTWPILRARATSPSPPFAATRWIRTHVPRNAVVLHDLALEPHAEYLLRGWQSMRIDAGLARYGGDPAVPMVLLADGERGGAGGITFRWSDTDAYRKLTREHYGAVSVIPLPAAERFRVVEGIFAPERTRDGRSWRWIGAKGILELPSLGAHSVRIAFVTPPDYALDEDRVRVVAGTREATVTVRRDAAAEVVVPLDAGVTQITILPERSFIPARLPGGNNRDVRTISVMLTRVQQLGVR